MSRDVVAVDQAIDKILASKKRNFVESVDVAIRLSCDETISGDVHFMHPFVSMTKVLVFANDADVDYIQGLGVVLVGNDQLIDQIKNNKTLLKRVSSCVASASLASEIKKVAKSLTMLGIMPSLANGTIVNDVCAVVREIKGGRAWFKTSKAKVVYSRLGNVDFESAKLVDNLKCLLKALIKSNAKVKKSILNVSLSTTMGPSVFCDFASIAGEVGL